MATSPLLALADVELTLGGGDGAAVTHILHGVTLTLDRGETLAILGPSGSGKSSLMAIACGIERASGGSVRLDGHNLSRMSEDALARLRGRGIGLVLQSFHLLPTMTAEENVALPLELAGIADARSRSRAELETVGLGHRMSHYPAQLSGGEQQRVAIARATVVRPPLLMADEPTGNLDSATGGKIIDLLFERASSAGAALMVITHDREIAARCGRIAHMADGRLSE